ncbi:transmembrane protein 120 homolog [Impatiens glandulifera]|uniref:transmembrane protein 120 homolog n=1 Tax=Impatiens glandulifera TaxID=253017 RepID=UPI001FB0882F|nr:transmembrane protein 120 homolog [Impatiens glandulifera]
MASSVDEMESEKKFIAQEIRTLVDSAKTLQDLAAASISRAVREEELLRQRAHSLDTAFITSRSSIASSLEKRIISSDEAENLEEKLCRASFTMTEGDAAAFLPIKPHGRFLRLLLGPINVSASQRDVKLKVKGEYNKFRDTTAILFLVFPSLLLILRSWVWNGCLPALPVHLYLVWLLFLYTCLALRENILRVNGSDIRPWWIYHHYFAMATSVISLTWEIEREPRCAHKQRGVQYFLQWAILQGVAMLLQNRYQRKRLYTRIALGKARKMDVVWGETAAVDGQLWLLAPILFMLQGFKAYVGMLLLKSAFAAISDWQVFICGILLIIMAVGNFVNTIHTLKGKSRVKEKIKRSKSRQDLRACMAISTRVGSELFCRGSRVGNNNESISSS